MIKNKYVIGIDASRNRSGGAKAHIIGILESLKADDYDISEVHIWTYEDLALLLPSRGWLKVHTPFELTKNIFTQLFWQKYKLPKELKVNKVDILLSTDAGTVCRFEPSVVMSRDMLSFEPGEMGRYFPSKSWLRLFVLKYAQLKSIKSATASIFLTSYAKEVILSFTNAEKIKSKVIPHGISDVFRGKPKTLSDFNSNKFIYVSNADKYKHQWVLIDAFSKFLEHHPDATLTLVGANSGPCRDLVENSVSKLGSKKKNIMVMDFVKHDEIPKLLKQHDVFIFASSCENMPNTLIEAMASGLPILSSNRGPMPEVLDGSGFLFDPEDEDSILAALKRCNNGEQLSNNSKLSHAKALEFSWERCSKETFNYLLEVKKQTRGCND